MAQFARIRAEVRKLTAESDKLTVETRRYPLVVATALIASVITLTKPFL
ncbi:MAG: hypothetical protein QM718_05050 [Steroidobacteraceae bacterium]